MANIVNNFGSTIVQIFKDVQYHYERDLEIIKETEDELQDLMHEIELSAPKDMYQGWRLYTAIRDARIRRRTAKEEVEVLKDTYDFFQSQQGQSFKNKIQNLQGNAVKLRSAQESRTYKPRRRKDLTIEDKHSDEPATFEEMLKDFKKIKVSTRGGKLRK